MALTANTRIYSVDTFTQTYKAKAEERIPSVKTIYRLIDLGELEVKNIVLPQKLKRQSKNDTPSRPKGTNKYKIEERPESVLERKEVGHWEGDLVKGSKEKMNPLFNLSRESEAKTCYQSVKDL